MSNQFLGLWIGMVHWKKWCLELCPRDMAGYGNYLMVSHWYSLNVVCEYVGVIKCLFAAVVWYVTLGRQNTYPGRWGCEIMIYFMLQFFFWLIVDAMMRKFAAAEHVNDTYIEVFISQVGCEPVIEHRIET